MICYPVHAIKQYEDIFPDGSVNRGYKGTVEFPNNKKTQFVIDRVKAVDNSFVDTVKLSYEVPTKTGTKIMELNYNRMVNSEGSVNTLNKPSSLSYVDDSGKVVITTNFKNPVIKNHNSEPSAINLQPLTKNQADIKKVLDGIKANQKKLNEYEAPKHKQATQMLNHLAIALTTLNVSLDDGMNFMNTLIDRFNSLLDDFNNAKDTFTDVPTISIANGTCPFTITGKNRTDGPTKTYSIDPCEFVAPYK